MASKKETRTRQEAETSSQAPQWAPRNSCISIAIRNWGNIPHPLDLTNPEYITRYNALNSKLLVAARYYNEDVLSCFKLLDDIHQLFARGRMGQFLEITDHAYPGVSLEFLSTLHVEVMSDLRC